VGKAARCRTRPRRREPARLPRTDRARYISAGRPRLLDGTAAAREPRRRYAVWSMIQAAGWPIWPLIFASIVALALILERLWSLRQSVVAPAGMVDHVLVEFRHTGATQDLLARTAEQGPLGRILAAGLANVKS